MSTHRLPEGTCKIAEIKHVSHILQASTTGYTLSRVSSLVGSNLLATARVQGRHQKMSHTTMIKWSKCSLLYGNSQPNNLHSFFKYITLLAFIPQMRHRPSIRSCQAFLSFQFSCNFLHVIPILIISAFKTLLPVFLNITISFVLTALVKEFSSHTINIFSQCLYCLPEGYS